MSRRRRPPPPPEPELPEARVEGEVIRVFWDHAGPLWDDSGPLEPDAGWLKAALGLSHSLAVEIDEWAQHLSEWPHDQVLPASLRRQGERVVRRLAGELAGRYEVRWEF